MLVSNCVNEWLFLSGHRWTSSLNLNVIVFFFDGKLK